MRIEVTQEDIAGGIRVDAFYCPVALALQRQLPGYGYIGVLSSIVYLRKSDKEKLLVSKLPEECTSFIMKYDGWRDLTLPAPHDTTLEPFSFELPDPVEMGPYPD